jgi:hypothetical protein
MKRSAFFATGILSDFKRCIENMRVMILSILLLSAACKVEKPPLTVTKVLDLKNQLVINMRADTVSVELFTDYFLLSPEYPRKGILAPKDSMKTDSMNVNHQTHLIKGLLFVYYFEIDSVIISGRSIRHTMRLREARAGVNMECPNIYNARCWEVDSVKRIGWYSIR